MRNLDSSSWQAMALSFPGIALFSLVGVVIRLAFMQSVQQRRDRENRQINERLRTLIAASKALGGSFTGRPEVDPRHRRDSRDAVDPPGGERMQRIRDVVEAALPDIILLGTEEQVRLAARAASQLVAGHTVETAELVVSPRDFIRKALHLAPIPTGLAIPRQGPRGSSPGAARKAGARARAGATGKGRRDGRRRRGRRAGRDGSRGRSRRGTGTPIDRQAWARRGGSRSLPQPGPKGRSVQRAAWGATRTGSPTCGFAGRA